MCDGRYLGRSESDASIHASIRLAASAHRRLRARERPSSRVRATGVSEARARIRARSAEASRTVVKQATPRNRSVSSGGEEPTRRGCSYRRELAQVDRTHPACRRETSRKANRTAGASHGQSASALTGEAGGSETIRCATPGRSVARAPRRLLAEATSSIAIRCEALRSGLRPSVQEGHRSDLGLAGQGSHATM